MQVNLFHLRQLVQRFQSEHAQKIRRRLIDDWAARHVETSALPDELFCHKGADAVRTVHAADLLDKCLGRRLIIRDDRQRLEL